MAIVSTALLAGLVAPTAGEAAQSAAKAASYRLVLGDDDTYQRLGNAAARALLTNVHGLLAGGRVNAVIRLIPQRYKQSERALLKRSKWRNRSLLLMSTHLNADAPNVVYPGFVHRCASHSDYSKYDVADLRTLGRTVNRAKPCHSVWNYHGPVLVVNYSKSGRPYFRGLTFPTH